MIYYLGGRASRRGGPEAACAELALLVFPDRSNKRRPAGCGETYSNPRTIQREEQLMARRWKHRPEGSTWGDWGDDDQLGRLNLLTPEKTRQGVAEVREGLSFCLSLPLDVPAQVGHRRRPPLVRPVAHEDTLWVNLPCTHLPGHEVPGSTDIQNDDSVLMYLQSSTHWDSLAHVGAMFDADGDGEPEAVYYNGFRAGEHIDGDVERSRNTVLGVDNMAAGCLQGRGVLVDLHAHFRDEPLAIGYDDLARVLDEDDVVVESGDILLLHTGLAGSLMPSGNRSAPPSGVCCGLDGRDEALRAWITESGLVGIVADNYGVEVFPARPVERGPALPLHEHCLFRLGVHLGELFYLSELAGWLRQHGRSRFLLTAPPLRLPSAVGSPVTAVATV
jgi:hypothetical protein